MDKEDLDDLLSRLTEVEELLQFPSVAGHVERANALSVSIARSSRSGRIANLAMKLMSETLSLRSRGASQAADRAALDHAVSELRRALQSAKDQSDSQ